MRGEVARVLTSGQTSSLVWLNRSRTERLLVCGDGGRVVGMLLRFDMEHPDRGGLAFRLNSPRDALLGVPEIEADGRTSVPPRTPRREAKVRDESDFPRPWGYALEVRIVVSGPGI